MKSFVGVTGNRLHTSTFRARWPASLWSAAVWKTAWLCAALDHRSSGRDGKRQIIDWLLYQNNMTLFGCTVNKCTSCSSVVFLLLLNVFDAPRILGSEISNHVFCCCSNHGGHLITQDWNLKSGLVFSLSPCVSNKFAIIHKPWTSFWTNRNILNRYGRGWTLTFLVLSAAIYQARLLPHLDHSSFLPT